MNFELQKMEDNVLSVKNVSKKYCYNLKYARKYGLKDVLKALVNKRNHGSELRKGEFWALNNVSFAMKKGESIGLIGLNGAGKSTLLKMIKGLIMPDIGEINIVGEVGALIELGAGFHPMLSGRENIFVKGALLGKSKDEMNEKFREIVDFAELNSFIDAPLKSYSSGMHVRLGFAVAIFMQPDILLLDEVLAVGDFKFRQKCLDKVNQLKEMTSTIFVSHSMNTVSLFCEKAIVLEKGKIVFEGKTDDAIKYYLDEVETNGKKKNETIKEKIVKPFYGDLYNNLNKIKNVEHYWADKDYNRIASAETGDDINLVIRFELLTKTKRNLVIGVPIWNQNGVLITGLATDYDKIELKGDQFKQYEIILNFNDLAFNPNEYIAIIAIVDGVEFLYRGLNDPLTVTNYRRNFGFVTANHKWVINYE